MSRKKLNPSESELRASASAWLHDLMSGNRGEPVPEGWLTIQQMCEELGINERTMRTRLDALLREKKIQKRQYRIDIGKDVRPVWHYFKAPCNSPKRSA